MGGLSIYDLAFDYVVMFYDVPDITHEVKKEAIDNMASLLSHGWTSGEIIYNTNFFHNKYPGKKLDLENYFRGRTPKRINLLQPFQYFYHNELRLTTPPPVVEVDYNTGEIKRDVKPYYLEMKSSYTLEELYNYYMAHDKLYERGNINEAKIKGGLKWMVDKYGLELVLYMIDVADNLVSGNDMQPLSTVMDLQDYFRMAKDALNKRMTDVKSTGDDKIVPKRRVLPD